MSRALPATVAVVAFGALGLALGAAGGPRYWREFLRGDVPPPDAAILVVAGGDGASVPRASADSQGLDADALAAATQAARDVGAGAFAVARRGHAVQVWAANGEDARVRSALLARLMIGAGEAALGDSGLLAWSASQQVEGSRRNPWSARNRWRFGAVTGLPVSDPRAWLERFSREVWRPLGAADARVATDVAGVPRLHCCLWLRPRDALAVAVALLDGGQVGGEHLFAATDAARVLEALDDHRAPRGAEPFGARPARLWRDDEGSRLYFFPEQELAILLVGADPRRLVDETAIAHQVLRGIVDGGRMPSAVPAPRELVPAH